MKGVLLNKGLEREGVDRTESTATSLFSLKYCSLRWPVIGDDRSSCHLPPSLLIVRWSFRSVLESRQPRSSKTQASWLGSIPPPPTGCCPPVGRVQGTPYCGVRVALMKVECFKAVVWARRGQGTGLGPSWSDVSVYYSHGASTRRLKSELKNGLVVVVGTQPAGVGGCVVKVSEASNNAEQKWPLQEMVEQRSTYLYSSQRTYLIPGKGTGRLGYLNAAGYFVPLLQDELPSGILKAFCCGVERHYYDTLNRRTPRTPFYPQGPYRLSGAATGYHQAGYSARRFVELHKAPDV